MTERVDLAHLRHTATAQQHSAQDRHGVSVKPSALLALVEAVEAAHEARLNVYVGDRLGQALERFAFGGDA